MTKATDIIHAIEAITSGLKVTTSTGTYRVVGVTCATRIILGEDENGDIFEICPFDVESIEQKGTITIKRQVKP